MAHFTTEKNILKQNTTSFKHVTITNMHSHIISDNTKHLQIILFYINHHFSNVFYTLRLQKQHPLYLNTFLIKKFVLTKEKYKSENKRKKIKFQEKDRQIDPITLVLSSRHIQIHNELLKS